MQVSERQADSNSLAFTCLERSIFQRNLVLVAWLWLLLGPTVSHLLVLMIKNSSEAECWDMKANVPKCLLSSWTFANTLHFGLQLNSSTGNLVLTAFPKFLPVVICPWETSKSAQCIWMDINKDWMFELVSVESSAVVRTSPCSHEHDLKHHSLLGLAVGRSHKTDSNSEETWKRITSNWMEAFLLQHSCSPAD